MIPDAQTIQQAEKLEAVAKADHPRWIAHKLTDESWAVWRDQNPAEVVELTKALAGGNQGAPEPAQAPSASAAQEELLNSGTKGTG